MELVIITGLSGAGKSQAANVLEDIGFYCVDNIPPAIIPSFVDLSENGNAGLSRIALVTDARGGDMFSEVSDVLDGLSIRNISYKILFLDASDEVLIKRYKENRRLHPVSQSGKLTLSDAVKKERELLSKIKDRADYRIDTSHISISQLKEKLTAFFSDKPDGTLKIRCGSFGFKYGADNEFDLVFDVRCLPNPFYVPELKEKTGLDEAVKSFVLDSEESRVFLDKLLDFIDFSVPLYKKEGKSQLNIMFGCTGGKHRSVTFAEIVGEHLRNKGYDCITEHRDILKG